MKILSVHLFTHDASATYFDGMQTYYCKFERPTQIKKYFFHKHQCHYARDILKDMNIDWDDLDIFAFTAGELENERELDKQLGWQLTDGEFVGEVNEDLIDVMFPNLGVRAKKYYRIDHHYAHYMSGDFLYRDTMGALILDGNGDYQVHRSVFKELDKIDQSNVRDGMSIGHLFEIVSNDFLRPPTDNDNTNTEIDCAGKLMGLMSYGNFNEDYANFLRRYDLNMLPAIAQSDFIYARFIYKDRDDSPYPEGFFNDDMLWSKVSDVKSKYWWHVDWIHTWQEVIIEKIVEYAKQHFNKNDKFVFSGGVAHNVVLNDVLNQEFPNMVIPPCVGDEGLSLGTMWAVCRKYDIDIPFPDGQFSHETIETPSSDTIDDVVNALCQGKVVASVFGPGEIGPRALGNRSLLYAPFIGSATKYFHSRGIKKREWWRPYGIIILEEDLGKYLNTKTKSPYMLHVSTPTEFGAERLSGVIHADNTVRYQTVSSGPIYEILTKFKEQTGCSALVNTSCNAPGKPIVHTKSNAIEFCEISQPDYMMLGDEFFEVNQHA